MNNQEAARRGLERAALILDEAHRLYERKAWNLVVRRCQEVVELALKSALAWTGIEVPRMHDVGPVLKRHQQRFVPSFRARIPRLASISRSLRVEREISFYGDERTGIPPEELYVEADALEALSKAEEVMEACEVLTGNVS